MALKMVVYSQRNPPSKNYSYMHWIRELPLLIRTRRPHINIGALGLSKRHVPPIRRLSDLRSLAPVPEQSTAETLKSRVEKDEKHEQEEKVGGMSRRLAQMMDETIEQGGRSAQRSVDEAGFSEELRSRLEAKILDNGFKSDHPAAFSQLSMPVCSNPNLWRSELTTI